MNLLGQEMLFLPELFFRLPSSMAWSLGRRPPTLPQLSCHVCRRKLKNLYENPGFRSLESGKGSWVNS